MSGTGAKSWDVGGEGSGVVLNHDRVLRGQKEQEPAKKKRDK